jgi:hypothetical protein
MPRTPAITARIACVFTVMKFLFIGASGIVLAWGAINLARFGPA